MQFNVIRCNLTHMQLNDTEFVFFVVLKQQIINLKKVTFLLHIFVSLVLQLSKRLIYAVSF